MIKRTLYFSNPAYLSLQHEQLVVRRSGMDDHTVPVEDVGWILLDHPQITITHALIRALQVQQVAIISCDERHMPMGMMLPVEGHTLQSRRYRVQIEASLPLRKNLWKQTVQAKIANQAAVLHRLGLPNERLTRAVPRVLSGDETHVEGHAAAYYWRTLMGHDFVRDRYGDPPNALFNFGYAVLRSMTARALVTSGLLPTLGIHHRNQYNAYCLADDIMEPMRPIVDLLAYEYYIDAGDDSDILTKESRVHMLQLPTIDVLYGKHRRPLMVGIAHTTASLSACYEGKKKKIIYPALC